MRYLAALLLVACAGADAHETEPTVPQHTLRPDSYQAALLLRWADGVWERAGVDPDALVVAEPGPLGDSGFRADVSECGTPDVGSRIDGCQLDGRLLIAADITPERTLETAVHEMGHLLSGRYGHVTDGCPERELGSHVMCAYGSDRVEPTEADVAFVTRRGEGARGGK